MWATITGRKTRLTLAHWVGTPQGGYYRTGCGLPWNQTGVIPAPDRLTHCPRCLTWIDKHRGEAT